tara:strand:- start:9466 stop:9660 length:195 start_codon:yes stop_codon:yes gene_type:complete
METSKRTVLQIRVTEDFITKLDGAIKSVNAGRRNSDPFAQEVDRSKFVRSLVEDFVKKQEQSNG